MEKTIIDAIRSALPTVEVYHDFAPDNAGSPLAVLQRVGGAGNLFGCSPWAGSFFCARCGRFLWSSELWL